MGVYVFVPLGGFRGSRGELGCVGSAYSTILLYKCRVLDSYMLTVYLTAPPRGVSHNPLLLLVELTLLLLLLLMWVQRSA